jgi:hypothetical protein
MPELISKRILLFIFTALCCGATYPISVNLPNNSPSVTPKTLYVAQNCSGNCSGVDQSDYISIANTNNFTILNPGDTAYWCGTIRHQSDAGGDGIQILTSGLSGQQITITGNCPGNAGIIDGASPINSSWTSVGSNIYSTPYTASVLLPSASGIVTEDNMPLVAIAWKGSAASTIAFMAASVPNTISNSSTSNTVGTGSFTFTINTGLTIATGTTIEVNSNLNTFVGMIGTVTSYNSSTGSLVINATSSGGSGTFAYWYIYIGSGMWSYDTSNQVLYVMTTGLDSPSGHTMEASYGSQGTFLIRNTGSYVTLEDLTIENSADYMLYWEGFNNNTSPAGNIINNNTIIASSNWAVFGYDQTNLITHDNTITYGVWGAHTPSGNAFGECIRYLYPIGGAIYNNTIIKSPSIGIDLWHTYGGGVNVYNNTIHDGNLESLGDVGIYLDSSWNNFIYSNTIYSETVDMEVNAEAGAVASQNNYIYNNVLYNWSGIGFYIGDFGFPTPITSQYNFIFNNDIVFVVPTGAFANGTSNGLAVEISRSWDDTFQNNLVYPSIGIFQSTAGINSNFAPGFFNYNTYAVNPFSFINPGGTYTFAAWQAYVHGDTNSGLPSQTNFPTLTFVSPSSPINLELLAASAPIGAGTNLTGVFNTDFNGITRESPPNSWETGAYTYPQ